MNVCYACIYVMYVCRICRCVVYVCMYYMNIRYVLKVGYVCMLCKCGRVVGVLCMYVGGVCALDVCYARTFVMYVCYVCMCVFVRKLCKYVGYVCMSVSLSCYGMVWCGMVCYVTHVGYGTYI